MNKAITVMLFVLLVLAVACLCTALNREQELLKASKLNVEVVEKRLEVANIDLDNALYKQWVYSILWKDVEKKDDWKKDVEELKRVNGYDN